MIRRFTVAVAVYIALCLVAIGIVILRGDGPHPRVVAIYPTPGDRYWPGGTAEITFSQSMDESSVERALQVSPGSQGQGVWYGNTLNLQPVGDWRPNVTYHVSLVGSVTDDESRPLATHISFWFRVHHVGRLGYCRIGGVRNICEITRGFDRPLTRSPESVLHYALSSDGSLLAYIRRDSSGLPHLFITQVDGTGQRQLTRGRAYADTGLYFAKGESSSVTYDRRPAKWQNGQYRLGQTQIWNIDTDGSNDARFR